MKTYESELFYEKVHDYAQLSEPHYASDCIHEIVKEVSPNYPQLTEYEKEWLMFSENIYHAGEPVQLEYQQLTDITSGIIHHAIPFHYKCAILKGSTKYRDIDTGDILDTFDATKNLEFVSIKMPVLRTTGKNLLSLDDVKSNSFNGNTVTKIDNGFNIKTTTTSTGWNQNVYMRIKVEPNTTYVYSVLKNVITDPYANMSGIAWGSGYAFIKGTQTNHTLIEGKTANNSRTNLIFNTGVNKEIIIYHCALADITTQIGEFELIDFQLEENSTGTSYEPFKSNILTVNEDINLRSNGEVYDELDLLTGRLTQRIDKNNEVLSQEIVKTVELSAHLKPTEGTIYFETSSSTIAPLLTISCPVVSTGKQTLKEINN